jgi:hypothetical protein
MEIRAIALEAMADDEQAASLYARRVEEVARSLPPNFQEAQIPSLREWWVGRAYARAAGRIDQARALEKSLRSRIERRASGGTEVPENRAPRMLLAFLLEGRGEEHAALAQWRSMVPEPAASAAALPANAPADSAKTGF